MRVGILGIGVDTRVFEIEFLVEETWMSKILPTRIGAIMGICTIILRECNYHAGGIYKQDP